MAKTLDGVGHSENAVKIDLDVVPPPVGGESQDCYFRKVESDVDIDVGRIVLDFTKGTHHMHVYATDDDSLAVDDHREECFQAVNFDKWRLVFGEQREYTEWELPEGVAIHLKAHQQLLIQVHYVNIQLGGASLTTAANPHGSITFDPLPPGVAKEYMGSIFGQQRGINIAPHSQQSISGVCNLAHDVHMGALAGHYHLRGQDFYAFKQNPDGSLPKDPFYTAASFAEPAFDIYDPEANPLTFKAGDNIEWHCDYDNQSDEQVWFGPNEQHQEHCNMFAFYYPIAPGKTEEFTPCVSCGKKPNCPADETCVGDGICRKSCGTDTGSGGLVRTHTCDKGEVCMDAATNKCVPAMGCVPNCDKKTCGDDGCGGSCGTQCDTPCGTEPGGAVHYCKNGDACLDASTALCGPSACTPQCSGKTCGDDGCGGSCGTCATDQLCSAAGACLAGNLCDLSGGFESEPNDTWTNNNATPLCGDQIKGFLSSATDVDWFTWQVAPGETYTMTLSNLPADYTFNFYHLAASGSLSFINRSTDLNDLYDQVVTSTSVSGGTYFAKIYSYAGAFDASSPYTFTITRK